MMNDKLSDLPTNVIEEQARWSAQSTAFSSLTADQKTQMLGAVPPPSAPKFASREALLPDLPKTYPTVKDWRNINGLNYITSVKTQGLCQSCVAFSVCGAIEVAVRIAQKQADLEIDLSEAHLFYCNGGIDPCKNGWWPTAALDIAKTIGIAPDVFFPYSAGNQVCAVGTGWESKKVQIKAWTTLQTTADIKKWIHEKGPVVACLEIFSDIHTYSSGIYHHLTGTSLGWHSVCVVGYNDADGYWICKNCWGKEFGDQGFINIAYGECQIENYGMFGIDGVVESRWVTAKKVLALWANDKENNAWANIEGEGWKKIFAANRLIFFQILMQLIQAKNKNTPINIRLYDDVIREIYS
jgi:C1A family cysteine protease